MKLILTSLAIAVSLPVLAGKFPFERYQSIIDRRPFGNPPPGYDPDRFADEIQPVSGNRDADLSEEQQQLQKAIALHAVNIDPDGSTMVGFSDLSEPKSPKCYYMAVGETRNGWFVKEASPSATNAFMTVVKDSIEVTVKLGESTQPSATAARTRSSILRSPRANSSAATQSLRSRRAKRELEAAEQKRKDEEQKRKDEEAAAKAAEEKALREQERAEQRQQLSALAEEMKRLREEKQRQKEAQAQNEETVDEP